MTEQTLTYYRKRAGQLDVAYMEYVPMWRELAEFLAPRSCRFLISEANKKPKFSKTIVDSTAVIAAGTFASGLMSNASNPAHKWFKLGMKNGTVSYQTKTALAQTADLFRAIYNASNMYNQLPNCYEGMGTFGISTMYIEKDFETVINCKLLPIGSFKIAKDHRGVVDTLYREYSDTVGNVVEKFGEENVSSAVLEAYKNNQKERIVELVHAVEPNMNFDKKSKFSNKKRFISVYFEKGAKEDKLLEEKGFNHFPYIVFEASVNGEDVYPSNSPGITALPDVKQLMVQVKEYNKALKKIISPQLKGPASLENKKMIDAPSAFTAYNEDTRGKLEPIYQVNPQVLAIENAINNIKKIIGQHFKNDLFAMLSNSNFSEARTAYEWSLRKQEALVLLSPLLQQVHSGLKQILEVTFEICAEAGILPEFPPEVEGQEIDIQFVSPLAMAQRAEAIGATERLTTYAVNLATSTGDKTPIYKLNLAEIIDDYADFANAETDNIVPTDVVAARLQAEAKAQQAQQQMAALEQGSKIVSNMGGVDASGAGLLDRFSL